MLFQVSLVLSLFSAAQGKLDVVETAKAVDAAAKDAVETVKGVLSSADLSKSHSGSNSHDHSNDHNHNHNEDHLVDLLVQAKNDEGKTFASTLADRVNMERDGFLWMGITAKYSQIKELEENKNIVAVDIDHEEYVLESPRSVRRRLEEEIPWGIPTVLQDIGWWDDLDAEKTPIKVCVADTGYDLGHVDLPEEPDVDGTDGAGEAWSYDGQSHGTHCAGTIAALGSNDEGVTSVIPDNKDGNFMLIIGKAFDSSGRGSNVQTIDAVQGCVDKGATVISLSLGGPSGSRSARNFYEDLYVNHNILLIAAAGNDGNDRYSYPASFSSVMSVASLQQARRSGALSRSSFSQYNDQVEIAAPGSGVLSTVPGDDYGVKSGTSMATPHVAGVAALLWMYFPNCENYQIRHAMLSTAVPISADSCDVNTGFGLVQAKDAYDLLAEGNCGGDLGPEPSSADGGCDELYDDGDDSSDSGDTPTPSPTAGCGESGDSCDTGVDCCSGLCRSRAKTCRP